MKIAGLILIFGGILILTFRGIDFKEKKKIADIGPVEIYKEEIKTITVLPG